MSDETVAEPDFKNLFESARGLVAASNAYLRATMTRRAEIVGRHGLG